MGYSPFLYAFEQRNIALTGEGAIDGAADCEHWWPWKGRQLRVEKTIGSTEARDRLREMAKGRCAGEADPRRRQLSAAAIRPALVPERADRGSRQSTRRCGSSMIMLP
jgi:polygalacturonase